MVNNDIFLIRIIISLVYLLIHSRDLIMRPYWRCYLWENRKRAQFNRTYPIMNKNIRKKNSSHVNKKSINNTFIRLASEPESFIHVVVREYYTLIPTTQTPENDH